MHTLKKLIFVMIVMSCWQCKTKTPTTNTTTKNTETTAVVSQERPVARGTVRVIAKLIKVKPINTSDRNTACSKNPCEATITVEKIVGKGAFFAGEVNQGQQLDTYFIKTLGATKDVFPELKKHFPGLKKGDRFEADIIYSLKAANNLNYQVVSYQPLSK
ncbi:hypothetical protein [uncultured Microscilla sp.]|uniref:hypothetical protein n=1 Tax=uncultured Microscilla sp. TaxID=432653 RepID=UPI00261A54FC|nr:hypothetical protein [uncultured Microscilla sp.]